MTWTAEATGAGAAPTQHDLARALAYFWHPVCTLGELTASDNGLRAVQLLGRRLVVADLGDGTVACLPDRCPHRSTRLSVGWVDGGAIRCAYHGWRWGRDGRCVEIPSLPGRPIPPAAYQTSFEVETRYDLVWVRLASGATTTIPACPAWGRADMRIISGEPYTWPTAAARRVENFTDLSHFAWVHDGTLGRRDQPVPPRPALRRERGELRFEFCSPQLEAARPEALLGESWYRMPMPCTVDIEFALGGRPGARRHLWMTASPLDAGTCRTFWMVARNDSHDEPDATHLAFQALVLAEDQPVVCNQDPPELPLERGVEVSVAGDRVSLAYRQWLVELALAQRRGPAALDAALGSGSAAPSGDRPAHAGRFPPTPDPPG